MTTIKKSSSSTRRSDDAMDDDSDDKDSKRKSRNLSEKKRRDQFNLLVNELSSMVSSGGRKMDKSTVLKSTISFLKNHNEISVRSRVHEIQEDWKPTFLTNEEFTHLILEAVDGFIMVFSASGQIFYASESITSLLGHLPNDVLGMTIYEIACADEQAHLYNTLIQQVSSSTTANEEENGGVQGHGGQVKFSCHFRRGGTDSNQDLFELVQFVGYFRSDSDMVQNENNRYSGFSTGDSADTRLVFVGTGRVQTPQLIREMPLVDSSKSEFTSRHSLEWKFLFLDHRAPPIIGYLPFELLGTSGYDYYHIDDLDKVVSCHEALMQKGEGTSCYYRFLTKGQQWIWLQTRFYITYHQWNSKPEFIVCTHRVVSYVDVMKEGTSVEVLRDCSPNAENDSSTVWSSTTKGGRVEHGPSSNCTSMSADSPTSRHSLLLQQPQQQQQLSPAKVHADVISNKQQQQQVASTTGSSTPMQHQYVATIPMQPIGITAGYPAPVLSSLQVPVPVPIPPVSDNLVMSPAHSQLQADLQRKHAELQAMIGQQQAELRRVSEQLLMARLGILPTTPPQPNANSNNTGYPMCNVNSNNANGGGATVSSTTSVPTPLSGTTGPTVIVPSTPPITIPHHHHQQQQQQHQNQGGLIFSVPDSNTPPK